MDFKHWSSYQHLRSRMPFIRAEVSFKPSIDPSHINVLIICRYILSLTMMQWNNGFIQHIFCFHAHKGGRLRMYLHMISTFMQRVYIIKNLNIRVRNPYDVSYQEMPYCSVDCLKTIAWISIFEPKSIVRIEWVSSRMNYYDLPWPFYGILRQNKDICLKIGK
jgi:hypothetical protein